jgi:hypothetical protein
MIRWFSTRRLLSIQTLKGRPEFVLGQQSYGFEQSGRSRGTAFAGHWTSKMSLEGYFKGQEIPTAVDAEEVMHLCVIKAYVHVVDR